MPRDVSRILSLLRRLLRRRATRNQAPPPPENVIRSPLQGYRAAELGRFHLFLELHLLTASGGWEPVPCWVDSEAQHTYLPARVVNNLRLGYQTNRPCDIVTRTGTAPNGGYLSQLTYAFPTLPHLQFETLACFSRLEGRSQMPLLALSDLLPHFNMAITAKPSPRLPDGFLLLYLRDDHGGRPRR
jgi:hypothetical protein